ncbi:NADP-dependent 3-hydroxy acid dehydrogenase YdfG [Mycobacterium rhizamassiliense]|jgi:NAD(P)-dependent dehydrogenase (short-subunit alcohol dehydrogenase family)|uniref:NADP-dependent 3-hydroxy acid dehydrogenase YdfG n=1 Tax=Mycobacterium rhizamassiliense TaxID=1841860 RepID=A0A2U3NM93_9MYCO|nr:SDR family NAD(P)-dependent oxidoreductase [Mycobacterium rhizamassiliense]SPM32554.1 NADP-dependent 3-hydroxy acid dehydrogenase YdfG [Mycobacterium rhizamassiliense]
MSSKVWFITGVSRGFGRVWASAALERGDKVAATARDTSALADLVQRFGDAVLPLELDVTDREAAFARVAEAHAHFGRIDVVVNNAGYGQFGFAEELSEREVRDQMETNFFGAVWVTQAALPLLRAQGSGHILQVSSVGGLFSGPNLGLYTASKHALEAFSEALAFEVEPFGVKVTLIEPGFFATDWAGPSAKLATRLPAYDKRHQDADEYAASILGEPADPDSTTAALLSVVDAEKPPLRAIFGSWMLPIVEDVYQERLAGWKDWDGADRAISRSA